MFAIIETGGKQYKVAPGQALSVERLPAEPGARVEFDRVLLVEDDSGTAVGNPIVDGARVIAHVLEQGRGDKITVFKYKAKSNYRRKTGHRQAVTRLRVAEILHGEAAPRRETRARGRRAAAEEEQSAPPAAAEAAPAESPPRRARARRPAPEASPPDPQGTE